MHRPGLRSSLALRQPAGRNHSQTLRLWPKSVPSPSAKDATAALRPRRPAAPEPTGRNRPMSGRNFCRLRGRNVFRPFRPIKPAPRLDSAFGRRLSSQGGPVLCCAAAWWRRTLGTSFAIRGRFFLQAIFMDRGRGASAPPASPLPTPGADAALLVAPLEHLISNSNVRFEADSMLQFSKHSSTASGTLPAERGPRARFGGGTTPAPGEKKRLNTKKHCLDFAQGTACCRIKPRD